MTLHLEPLLQLNAEHRLLAGQLGGRGHGAVSPRAAHRPRRRPQQRYKSTGHQQLRTGWRLLSGQPGYQEEQRKQARETGHAGPGKQPADDGVERAGPHPRITR